MARPTTTTSRPAALAASATALRRATLEAKVVTATRPLAALTSLVMVAATSVSEGERPSRTALVESPTSASTPASFVGRQADDRRRIDLPVAGMQHDAGRGVDRQRMRFRNRMRDRDELDG